MSKYIDVDALSIGKANRDLFDVPEYADGWNAALLFIMDEPEADVQPTIHAHWIHWAWYEECSNCGQEEKWTRKYCPGCGAKMDEEVIPK